MSHVWIHTEQTEFIWQGKTVVWIHTTSSHPNQTENAKCDFQSRMCEFSQNIMVSIKMQMRSLSSDGSGGDLQSVTGNKKNYDLLVTNSEMIVGSKVCVVPMVLPYYHTRGGISADATKYVLLY